jgi:hypothetical protein
MSALSYVATLKISNERQVGRTERNKNPINPTQANQIQLTPWYRELRAGNTLDSSILIE